MRRAIRVIALCILTFMLAFGATTAIVQIATDWAGLAQGVD